MSNRKQSRTNSRKKHHKVMTKFITTMIVRRYETKAEIVSYLMDAMVNNKSVDDIYWELVNWAATKYGD